MSTAITFGMNIESNYLPKLKESIVQVNNKYGYGTLYNLESIDVSIKEGVLLFKDALKLNLVYLISTPFEDGNSYANNIHEELVEYQTKSVEPVFFKYLNEISQYLKQYTNNMTICFSSDWDEDTLVRKVDGTLNELLELLKNTCNWHLELFSLQDNYYFSEPKYPLIFKVIL